MGANLGKSTVPILGKQHGLGECWGWQWQRELAAGLGGVQGLSLSPVSLSEAASNATPRPGQQIRRC